MTLLAPLRQEQTFGFGSNCPRRDHLDLLDSQRGQETHQHGGLPLVWDAAAEEFLFDRIRRFGKERDARCNATVHKIRGLKRASSASVKCQDDDIGGGEGLLATSDWPAVRSNDSRAMTVTTATRASTSGMKIAAVANATAWRQSSSDERERLGRLRHLTASSRCVSIGEGPEPFDQSGYPPRELGAQPVELRLTELPQHADSHGTAAAVSTAAATRISGAAVSSSIRRVPSAAADTIAAVNNAAVCERRYRLHG